MNFDIQDKKEERVMVGFRMYPSEVKELKIALAKADITLQVLLRNTCLKFIKNSQ